MHLVGTLDGIVGDCNYQSHGSIVAVDAIGFLQRAYCPDQMICLMKNPNHSSEPGSAEVEPEVAAGLAPEAAWPAPKAAARLAIFPLSVNSKHGHP